MMKFLIVLTLSTTFSLLSMNEQNNKLNLLLKDGDATIDQWKIDEYTAILKQKILWNDRFSHKIQQPIILTNVLQEELNICNEALTKTPEKTFKKYYRNLSSEEQTILCNGAGKLGCATILTQIIRREFPQELIEYIEYSMSRIIDYCIYRRLQLNQNSYHHHKKLIKKNINNLYTFGCKNDGSLIESHKDLFDNDNVLTYNFDGVQTARKYHEKDLYTTHIQKSTTTPNIIYFVIEKHNLYGLWITKTDDDSSSETLILNPDKSIGRITFSQDGSYLAIGLAEENNNNVIIKKLGKELDLSDTETTTCTGHSKPVFTFAFNPESTMLVSGSDREQDNLKIWDLSGNLIINIENHKNELITELAFNSDGSQLITCSYNHGTKMSHVILWDTSDDKKFKLIKEIHTDGYIPKIVFTLSNKAFVILSSADVCIVFDSNTGLEKARTHFKKTNIFEVDNQNDFFDCGIIFSPDENFFVAFHRGKYSKIIFGDMHNSAQDFSPLVQLNTHAKCNFIGLTPDMDSLIAGFSSHEDNAHHNEQWGLYNDKEDKAFDFIINNTTLLQKYALYNLLQAAKNKKESIPLNTQSPVYNALTTLTQNSDVAYIIQKYLPRYTPTIYEQAEQEYKEVTGKITNWFNSFK